MLPGCCILYSSYTWTHNESILILKSRKNPSFFKNLGSLAIGSDIKMYVNFVCGEYITEKAQKAAICTEVLACEIKTDIYVWHQGLL